MLIVVEVQTFHCSYPHLTIRVDVDIIGTGVVKALWITGLHILFQRAGFYIQYHHSVSIGSYPQIIVTVQTEGMGILTREDILMRIIEEAMLFGGVAHKSTIITGNPDTSLFILAETGDDIANGTIIATIIGKCLKTFADR